MRHRCSCSHTVSRRYLLCMTPKEINFWNRIVAEKHWTVRKLCFNPPLFLCVFSDFAIDCRISYRSEVQDQEGGGVSEQRWHYWILYHLTLDAQRQWTPLFEGIYDGRHDIIFRNILTLRFTIIIVALHYGRDIKKKDGRSSFVQRGLSSRIGTAQCLREDRHNRVQNAIIL
jgi:hypothetical protein